VSSANLLRVHSNSSSRSLMKKLNKTGPSTDPWGTPLVTSLQLDMTRQNLVIKTGLCTPFLHAQRVPAVRSSDLFYASQAQQHSRDILPRVPEKRSGEAAKQVGISCKWTQILCSKVENIEKYIN